jgi:hypothetical protein
VYLGFLWQEPDGNKPLRMHVGVHERIILKWIFKSYGTGLTGTSTELL